MLAVANNGAPAASPWQSAPLSTDSSSTQLSSACALLALLLESQTASQSGSRTAIEVNAQRLEELKQELAEAIQKAKDAADSAGFLGFLGDVFGSDIAQIAGAVAAVGAMIATGGAAAPLLMIALAEGLQLGAKAGAELGLDPKLCMALSLASVAVGICSPGALQAAGNLAQFGRALKAGGEIAQGASIATGAGCHIASGYYTREVQNYQADVVLQRANEHATNLDFDDALSRLQNSLRAAQRETSTVSEIVQNNTDTNTALIDRI